MFGAFEVRNSSWICKINQMNRVHPYHKDEFFADMRHFILSFHDSIFECVAKRYTFTTGMGSAIDAATKALNEF